MLSRSAQVKNDRAPQCAGRSKARSALRRNRSAEKTTIPVRRKILPGSRIPLLNTLNCHNFFNLRRVVRANVKKWSRVRRSVRLSVPLVDSSSGGRRRFPAELGRGQQIDSCCCGGTCGPRKCWSDGKEVGHVSARYCRSGHVTSRCALRSVT